MMLDKKDIEEHQDQEIMDPLRISGPITILPLHAKPDFEKAMRRRISNGSHEGRVDVTLEPHVSALSPPSSPRTHRQASSAKEKNIMAHKGDYTSRKHSHLISDADEEEQVSLLLPQPTKQNQLNRQSSSSSSSSSIAPPFDTRSYLIICFVILVGDTARGVIFPTLWSLVEHIFETHENVNGTSKILLLSKEQFQGMVVAAFSFGRFFAAPYFGRWSNEKGCLRVLSISLLVLAFGSFMYSTVGYVKRYSALMLITSQIISGVGSGTLGVTRSYVADISPKVSRTKYMAQITAVQYAGFTVTPLIGSILSDTIHDKARSNLLQLDAFSAPAYFMICLCVVALLLLHTRFVDLVPKKKIKTDCETCENESLQKADTNIAIIVCMMLNIVTKGSIACFETMGMLTATESFGMTSSDAGLVVSVCGSVGVISLVAMGIIQKIFTDIQIILFGMTVMLVGIAAIALAPYITLSTIPGSWVFICVIFFVYSVGYPLSHTAAMALYSKIVGKRPQGELMGWFASCGSLARIMFPILSGILSHGNNVLFLVLISMLVSAMIVVRTSMPLLISLSNH